MLNAESDIDQEEVVVSISKELYIGGGVWMKRGNRKKRDWRREWESFTPIRPCSTLGLLVKDEQISCSDKNVEKKEGSKTFKTELNIV